jgi:hypothetical protein
MLAEAAGAIFAELLADGPATHATERRWRRCRNA